MTRVVQDNTGDLLKALRIAWWIGAGFGWLCERTVKEPHNADLNSLCHHHLEVEKCEVSKRRGQCTIAYCITSVTIVKRSSDGIAEYRRQRATSASPRPCTLKRGSNVLCSPKQGHVSLHCTQHASPRLRRDTIDLETRRRHIADYKQPMLHFGLVFCNQCFTLASSSSETRLDHVRCSPKRCHLFPLCLRRDPLYSTPFPLAQDETPLISKKDKPKIGQEKKV